VLYAGSTVIVSGGLVRYNSYTSTYIHYIQYSFVAQL